MEIIQLRKNVLTIRFVILSSAFLFLLVGWITYDAEKVNLLWITLFLILLTLWNIFKYFFSDYKVISSVFFSQDHIIRGKNNEIINLLNCEKIIFYRNGFKGELKKFNFFALNHFMPKDGVNKLSIYFHNRAPVELFFVIYSSSEMRFVDDWFEQLKIAKVKKKFKGIGI